ncbi:MAG: FimV family protein [Methylococcus sp.]
MSTVTNPLVILGLLIPAGAMALGIGEIRAHSALNQKLSAEIPLVLSGNDTLETLRIRLASPEAFERAGVERSPILAQLRFTPIAKTRGLYAIQISSADVIHEPFLDFLLEVESPTGALLKEFTLLLDPPPGLYPADSNALQDSPSFRPVPLSRYDLPEQSRPGRAEIGPPTDSAETSAAVARRQITSSPPPVTARSYGPVRRGERLLEIAQRIERPTAVTSEQMAVGLYLANPRAFRGHPNGLKTGSRLRIPTQEFLHQIATEDYGEMLRGALSRDAYRGEVKSEFMPAANLHGLQQSLDRSGGIGPVAEVSARITSALKKENDELREQVSHLEQRLEEAQRLLSLKNAELDALHQQSVLQKERSEVPVTAPERVDQPQRAEAAPDVPPTPQAPTPVPLPKQRTEPALKPPLVVSQTSEPERQTPMAPGFLLTSGGLLLLGLGLWLYRRRRVTGTGEDLPLMASPAVSSLGEVPSHATRPDAIGAIPASPLPQPPSDGLAAEADALDPLWEADVYLRYGRFAQAENLMREAIKIDPARHELKLKLFEILDLANKTDAFLDYVQELQASQPGLPLDFWAAVGTIRPDLQPDTEVPEKVTVIQPQPPENHATPDSVADAIQLADIDNTDFSQELAELQAQHERITQAGRLLASDAQPVTDVARELQTPGVLMAEEDSPGNLTLEAENTDFSAELRELETQAQEEGIAPPVDRETASPMDTDQLESAPAEAPDSSHLIEFEAPVLVAPPPEPDQPDLDLDNLIDFDTSNLNVGLLDPQANPASTHPAPPLSEPGLMDIEFDQPQDNSPDALTQRKVNLGSLDFPLELVDPAEQASTGSPVEASIHKEASAGSCADLLAQAREFANKDEKAASRQILQQVLQQGRPEEREEAEALMQELGKVRLTIVPPPPSRKAS